MAVTSSGQVSLANLASEFGGTAPHSMSEYYKGAEVPSYFTDALNVYVYSPANHVSYNSGGGVNYFYYGGSYIGATSSSTLTLSIGSPNYINYVRGSYVTYVSPYPRYRISRYRYPNQKIPTSGEVQLSDFYGSTNT
jgi:hypothetical protein